jgi:MFS family permease
MEEDNSQQKNKIGIIDLPRNVWAVGATSFLMDVSSKMVSNIVPLFLKNILGVQTDIIGLIEGIAEATASVLKLFSGWLSDKVGGRKWLAVLGYGISALFKPFYYIASSWGFIAGAEWADKVGKGIRTAPRDALVADSVSKETRGLAFGFRRTMDTAGAMVGIAVAALIVWLTQKNTLDLSKVTYQKIVLVSLLPAFLSVLMLIFGSKDVPVTGKRELPKFSLKSMGKPFSIFLVIVSIFTLGNSSDAFLILRAQNLNVSTLSIMIMLVVFNLVCAVISTPAGKLSDRVGRRRLIIGGWLAYAVIYLGFALAKTGWQVWVLYVLYALYYGLAFGTYNALVADLVPDNLRGTAYGTYNAVIGLLAFPSSFIAGILWEGIGGWTGFGPSAPFYFGGGLALLAALLMLFWMPKQKVI